MAVKPKILLEGLAFGESPRWHDDKLWFSDMHAHWVMNVDLNGKAKKIVEVPGQPSGLGWLPNGRLLIVSMTDKWLLRLDKAGLVEVADLSRLASGNCNDMVVDKQGRAYIGHFGFDLFSPQPSFTTAEIIMVTPDGDKRIVADKIMFPNGSVITPDGHTLIVAETFGKCLTAFRIESDGSLSKRRVWANLGDKILPDGICLDAEGAIWCANAGGNEVVRVKEGGEVVGRIEVTTNAIACMLGGPDRRTLFILTAGSTQPDECREKAGGRVEIIEVEVPGAGLP
jgi:sugar lactone lactonase YvrE